MENGPDIIIKTIKRETMRTDRCCNTSGEKCRAKEGEKKLNKGVYI